MNRLVRTTSLEAMSTTVTVVSIDVSDHIHAAAMDEIAAEVHEWEQRFSRFLPGSMLTTVNEAAGHWTPVDRDFIHLLAAARHAVFATDGRFNPAILDALAAHGYNRTISELRTRASLTVSPVGPVMGLAAWEQVEIDLPGLRVRLPEGMHIDFGGIAKGALADRVADGYSHWPGGAISIGGDVCVWGIPPDGDMWRVGIEDPREPAEDITVVNLATGEHNAIATSSRTRRAWQTDEGTAHHLIDPITGKPTEGPLLSVSACAPTASLAEVTTKNLMVAAAQGPIAADLLAGAHWALAVSDIGLLTCIGREIT